jgi:hypothetical protein
VTTANQQRRASTMSPEQIAEERAAVRITTVNTQSESRADAPHANDEASRRVPPPADGWPGLIPWLGEGFFRTLGYLMFVVAGVALAQDESIIAIVGALVLGHFSVCTAEVVNQMEREKHIEGSSANK